MPFDKTSASSILIKPAKEKVFNSKLFIALTIGIFLGLIVLLPVDNTSIFYILKALQLILFFVTGSLCCSSKKNFLADYTSAKPQNHIVLIALLLSILLSTLYIFFKKDVWLMALSSSAAFSLPYFFKSGWYLFATIPRKQFNTWIPETNISGRAAVSLDSFLVRLKLTQHISDVDEKTYTVFIPRYIKLGDFFSQFLSEHNKHIASAIEDSDAKKNKYAWEFITIRFFGLQIRRLDPDLTVYENNMRKDALVFVKRLRTETKISSYNKNILNETVKQH